MDLSSGYGRKYSDAVLIGDYEILFFDDAVHHGDERPLS